MTKNDVVTLFRIICVLFPQSAKNFASADPTMRDSWHAMLADQPVDLVVTALKKYSVTHVFAPSIAEILKIIGQIRHPENNIDPDEAWGCVLAAIRRYGADNAIQALESLPPIVADTVRTMGWRDICMSENGSVDRGQFRKAYETRLARVQESQSMPQRLKEQIQTMSAGFQMQQLSEADREFLREDGKY